MNQLKSFSPRKAGSKNGYCLQNVRLGYGIASKYPDAWTAWKNTEQHKNRSIPKNLDVPLYYDYTDSKGNRYGHINVQLKDGRIWNDGNIYKNLTTFELYYSNVKYVGWGESVNNVKVIGGTVSSPTKNDINNAFNYLGISDRTQHKDKDYNYYMARDKKVLYTNVLNALYGKYKNQAKAIKIKDAEIARLKANGNTNEDITYIRSKVDAIWDKLTRIFK